MYNNLKNSVTLIGHLGKDPESREYTTGKRLTRFSLATNDYYKKCRGRTPWSEPNGTTVSASVKRPN